MDGAILSVLMAFLGILSPHYREFKVISPSFDS